MKNTILHVITSLDVGGAEKNLFNLIKKKYEDDYTHEVIFLKDRGFYCDQLRKLKIRVIPLSLNKNIFSGILKLTKISISGKYKIIQGWMYHGNLIALYVKLFNLRSKLFWNIRQSLYNIDFEKKNTKIIIYLNSLLSKIPNQIFCNSKKSISQHMSYGFNKKFIKINNAIDETTFFKSLKLRNQIRYKYKISESEICISLIQRYHPMKNHKLFFKCASKLLMINKHLKFLVIGNEIKKNKIFFIKNYLSNKSVRNFIFLDEQKNLNPFLNASDYILNVSSWGEGLSNILIESIFTETSFLTSDVGDNKELAKISNNFFYNNNNENELLNILNRIIKKHKYNYKNKLPNHIIKQKFKLKNVYNSYLKYYGK